MSWLEFFSSLINSLAWPITLLVFISIFKKEIAELMGKLKALEIGSNKITFSDDLPLPSNLVSIAETKQALNLSGKRIYQEEDTNEIDDFDTIAKLKPDLAIIQAFEILENKILDLQGKIEFSTDQKNTPLLLLQKLYQMHKIPESHYQYFKQLSHMKDKVMHDQYDKLEYTDAIAYRQSCKELIAHLENIV